MYTTNAAYVQAACLHHYFIDPYPRIHKNAGMRMIKEAYASFKTPRTFFSAAAIFLGYLIGAELSYSLYESPAVFPVHSGVALAGIVLAGIQFWPAIFFAALISYWWHDLALFLALFYSLGNAIQAITGAYILRYIGFEPSLRRMRDILSITLVAISVSAIVPAMRFLAQDLYLFLGGEVTETSFGVWWVGHIFSLLIVAPFLIRWIARPLFKRDSRVVLESFVALGLLFTIYGFIFFTTIEQINGIPFIYLIFPPLFWIALRLGSRFMTLALFITSIIAIVGTTLGYATNQTTIPIGDLLFLTEIFLIVIGIMFLLVTAIEEERRTATARLEGHIDQLEEALEKIRTEDKAKTTFVATLAHELRNPLAPILSTIELLSLRGPDAKDFPTMLGTMRDRVRTMARLLDDLLDISRITHEKLRLQKSTVNIVGVVKSSVESMSSYMQKRNLTFNVTLPQSENLMLEADPIRLEQILVNLLHNAAKYTDVGGAIGLSVARENGSVSIKIRDSGVGIEPHMLQKIFEPFLQVRQTSGGLGIGLSLTKRLVELHGGTIEAKSDGLGHGSEFIVSLPLTPTSTIPIQLPAAATTKEIPHVSHVEPLRAGLRVLLVDDNHAATETLGKLLEFKGYTVRFAHNGESTLLVAREFDPHIIMLDIGLPDINGYDVAKKIRSESVDVGLIALTGYGQAEDVARAQEAGFDHHLTKPVAIADLEKTLKDLFESRLPRKAA